MNDESFKELQKLKNISIKIDREKDLLLVVENMMKSYYLTESTGVEPIYSEQFFRRVRINNGN